MGGDLRFLANFYVGELWKRRWLVVGIAWLVGMIGAVIVMMIPDRYEAKAQIYVDTEALLLQVLENQAASFDTERQVENVRQLMYARPNLERVIKNTDLDLTVDSAQGMEALVRELQQRMSVLRTGRDLYEINYSANDPSVAQKVVQEVLNNFIEQNLLLEQTGTDKSRTFLAQDLEELKADLEAAEQELAKFRSENVELLSDTSSLMSRLREAESTLEQSRIERSLLEARRDQLSVQLANTPETLSQGGGSFPNEAARRLAELRAERSRLLQVYTPNHPDVKALERQITALEESGTAGRVSGGGSSRQNPVYTQLEDQLNSVKLQLAQLDERRRSAQKTADEIRAILEKQPAAQQRYDELKANYDQIFQEYRNRRGDLSVIEMTDALKSRTTVVDYRVIEPPIEPITPVGPNRFLLFTGVLFAAIGAGLGVAFLRIQFVDTFPSIVHLRQAFEMPILGSVSLVRNVRSVSTFVGVGAWATSALALFVVFGGLIYLYEYQLFRPDMTGIKDQIYFFVRSVA